MVMPNKSNGESDSNAEKIKEFREVVRKSLNETEMVYLMSSICNCKKCVFQGEWATLVAFVHYITLLEIDGDAKGIIGEVMKLVHDKYRNDPRFVKKSN